jgi:hypothetical protein
MLIWYGSLYRIPPASNLFLLIKDKNRYLEQVVVGAGNLSAPRFHNSSRSEINLSARVTLLMLVIPRFVSKPLDSSPHFSQVTENGSAGLQTGCPEGLPALRAFARPAAVRIAGKAIEVSQRLPSVRWE